VAASETRGNNADTCLDTDSNNLCDRRATATGDVFDFAFTDAFNLANDPAPDADAALANAFYWTNIAHDWLYPLGFDEAAGNFQLDNFGRGAAGGDEVRVDIHESVSTLARITVAPDGIAARIDLGLSAGVRRDSAFDADVILHEYAHGLTTRLIGGRNSVTGLYIWQSGAMGRAGATPTPPRSLTTLWSENTFRQIPPREFGQSLTRLVRSPSASLGRCGHSPPVAALCGKAHRFIAMARSGLACCGICARPLGNHRSSRS